VSGSASVDQARCSVAGKRGFPTMAELGHAPRNQFPTHQQGKGSTKF